MSLGRLVIAGFLVGALGCQTTPEKAFRPVEVQLETASGGAQYLIVRNSSGQELHNYRFSVHLWSEHSPHLGWKERPFGRYDASGSSWAPGKVLRFRMFYSSMENPITEPISRVEVVGHCEQGHFRQSWVAKDFGQLHPSGENP
jgi:hypothetical protein